MKLYHASRNEYKLGTILIADEHSFIYLSTSDQPHSSILHEALDNNYFVYEVVAHQDLRDGRMPGEMLCQQATIGKCVARARDYPSLVKAYVMEVAGYSKDDLYLSGNTFYQTITQTELDVAFGDV